VPLTAFLLFYPLPSPCRRKVVLNDFFEYRFQPLALPPPSLVEDLKTLVNNPDLSDVTFIVEGQLVSQGGELEQKIRMRVPLHLCTLTNTYPSRTALS